MRVIILILLFFLVTIPSLANNLNIAPKINNDNELEESVNENPTQKQQKIEYSKIKRTNLYPIFYYQIVKECEMHLKKDLPTSMPFNCVANKLLNPVYYQDKGYINGTLPFVFAALYSPETNKSLRSIPEYQLQLIFYSTFPQIFIKMGNDLEKRSSTINDEIYNRLMYGTGLF